MNIVDGRARPQLVDFGIGAVDPAVLAQLRSLSQISVSRSAQNTVSSSDTSGTGFYIPPECNAGQKWTTQGDLYSLGVVLYQLVADHSPVVPWHYRSPGIGWERHIADELLREDIELCLD